MSNEYEIVVGKEKKEELNALEIRQSTLDPSIKREQYIADSEVDSYRQLVSSRVKSFKGEATADILLLLALNKVNKREDSQYEIYPLTGMESVVSGIRDYEVLTNNNYIISDNPNDHRNKSSKRTVYFVVAPPNTEMEMKTRSNQERLEHMLNKYSMFVDDFELHLFFDTDDYDQYQEMRREMESIDGLDFFVINEVKQDEIISKAEVVVSEIPPTTVVALVQDPISALGIPYSQRRNKVAILTSVDTSRLPINYSEIWHLLNQRIPQLLAGDSMAPSLASYASGMWLLPQNYKFRGEYIQDFFNSPSIVSVRGLSPIPRGVIKARKMEIKVVLAFEGGPPLPPITLKSANDVHLVEDEDVLRRALLVDAKNTRNKLILLDGQVCRVESVKPSLTIYGKCINASKPGVYEISRIETITLLSPYHREKYYEALEGIKGIRPYALPDRFEEYILRMASLEGYVTEGNEWFRRENLFLPYILQSMSVFNMESLLSEHISPLNGVKHKNLIIDWGVL